MTRTTADEPPGRAVEKPTGPPGVRVVVVAGPRASETDADRPTVVNHASPRTSEPHPVDMVVPERTATVVMMATTVVTTEESTAAATVVMMAATVVTTEESTTAAAVVAAAEPAAAATMVTAAKPATATATEPAAIAAAAVATSSVSSSVAHSWYFTELHGGGTTAVSTAVW